jgi:DNA uptake protein ComE-like DNA-binding protein
MPVRRPCDRAAAVRVRVVRIRVCARWSASAISEAAMGEPVNINDASICALESAFHSGKRARQILNTRELLGDFKSWNDVKERLPGIDDEMIRSLQTAGVTVGSR